VLAGVTSGAGAGARMAVPTTPVSRRFCPRVILCTAGEAEAELGLRSTPGHRRAAFGALAFVWGEGNLKATSFVAVNESEDM